MIVEGNYHFGQDEIINRVDELIRNLKKGKGGLLFVEGDTGSGKTNFLSAIKHYMERMHRDIKVVRAEAQVPVANFKVASVQPCQPFINIVEELEKSNSSAKTKLAQNIGLTVLASLPIVDTFAYAYKEINRDIKQFHQEERNHKSTNSNSIFDFFLAKINNLRKDKKILILLDNMHWSDAQSVDFLNGFINQNFNAPFVIICAYREFILDTQGLPLVTIINNELLKDKVEIQHLRLLNLDNIRELSKIYFTNYKNNQEFEEWIYEKSDGNPGMVCEYLRYFSKYSPFNDNGELAMNFKDNEFLPSTWSAVFSQQIEILSEEEKHILTICAAEGVEFTANIVAQLLSCDVLETIKKLRAIQNKTGFIKSIGPQLRYGIKTTTYKFSQVFYHTFFENLLEYEETIELHSRISEILKLQFINAEDESIKNQIAPYLAAHSIESGDPDTASEVLYFTAQNNREIGGDGLIDNLQDVANMIAPNNLELSQSFDNLKSLIHKHHSSDDTEPSSNYANEINLDFNSIKKMLINDLLNDNATTVANKINMYINEYGDYFSDDEKVQFYLVLAKSNIDSGQYLSSKEAIDKATLLINNNIITKDTTALYNNTLAIYFYSVNDIENAMRCLEKNALISQDLATDAKIMTSVLISRIYKESSNDNYKKYKDVAIELSKELNYEQLKDELLKL
ncbi:MAG TPA: AAA family ATPase [Candidatus Kapabacteria bacterium]|nr:AAA family ATPase [Candidatus Kapabacteria bacterium]